MTSTASSVSHKTTPGRTALPSQTEDLYCTLTMMCKLLVLALVAVVPLVSMAEELSYEKLEEMETTWKSWKKQHGRDYSYSSDEEAYRKMIFLNRLLSIEKHNSNYPEKTTYLKGLNQFSDMTVDEYIDYNGMNVTSPGPTGLCQTFPDNLRHPKKPLPPSWDWRNENVVNYVRNQWDCNSGWAFSVAAAVEAYWTMNTSYLLTFSVEQLIDCTQGNDHCFGGTVDNAYYYIIYGSPGLEPAELYPYYMEPSECYVVNKFGIALIVACVDLPIGDEYALQAAVATVGPIVVGVDPTPQSFMEYAGGVYVEPKCSNTRLGHNMLLVGYGTENGQDYWLVKNSWGMHWGIKGYMKIARNHGNMCGIATQPSYPILE